MNLHLPEYEHTQRAPLYLLLLAIAIGLLAGTFFLREIPAAFYAMSANAAIVVVCAFSFGHLTVRDEGEQLAVRFGPLPLFRKCVPYEQIFDVVSARSGWLDGWGIHYNRHGWIYNLWGFDCVRVTLPGKSLRIGTDDQENLVSFLEEKVAAVKRTPL